MEEVLIFGMFVVLGAALFGFALKMTIKRQALWERIAKGRGLTYGDDEIRGQIGDVSMHIWSEVRGHKDRQSYTYFTASLDGDVPAGLSLVPEGFFRKLGKLAGMEDIQLGLDGVDEKMTVRAAGEHEVRRWAQHEQVARALRDLVDLDVHFEVSSEQIKLQFHGTMADGEQIESLIDRLLELSAALSRREPNAPAVDGAW